MTRLLVFLKKIHYHEAFFCFLMTLTPFFFISLFISAYSNGYPYAFVSSLILPDKILSALHILFYIFLGLLFYLNNFHLSAVTRTESIKHINCSFFYSFTICLIIPFIFIIPGMPLGAFLLSIYQNILMLQLCGMFLRLTPLSLIFSIPPLIWTFFRTAILLDSWWINW